MDDDFAPLPPAAGLPDYAELYCRSNFSFLHGASHAAELVERAIALGYKALAITDECTLAGVVRAHAACKEQMKLEQNKDRDFRLIIGSCFRFTGLQEAADTSGTLHPLAAMTLVALANNREGYGNLSELITRARTRPDAAKGSYLLQPEDFSAPPPALSHLRALPDCQLILVPDYAVDAATLESQLRWFKPLFGERGRLGLTRLYRPLDEIHRDTLEQAARRHGVPQVAVGDVLMHNRSRKYLLDVVTAIRLGKPVQECGYALAPNAEQHLRQRLRLAQVHAAPVMAETLKIAAACRFNMDELRYEYPDELVPLGMSAADYLRQETLAGAHRRYPGGVPGEVREQIEKELALIAGKEYEAYFLTVYDLVKFAREKGILCQGRGSAANSAVCYCLGVTEVDPTSTRLLFARFISEKRDEPPDIDVDFEHQRREEVIQHIYRKYGRRRAALAAAVHSYRPRGALREVGKALGVDPSVVDTVAKAQHWFDSREELLERFKEAGLDPELPQIGLWAGITGKLLKFPRHLSQHTGGFVIARGQLSRLVPIQNAAMQDRSVIEWDKDDLESLRLLKVDVLALGMLTALRRTLELVSLRRGLPQVMRMHDIPREDPATYDMICEADTIGVFQIESRAQMSMLPRMQPRTHYDLVVQVAIVRPGPIQGGMVHPYLQRRELVREGGSFDYPDNTSKSGKIKKVLERTLGIPIFQEQVMEVAIEAGGYSPSEADDLRRSMAAWKRKGGMGPHHERLVLGMTDNGYSRDFAENIFKQIQGFGEYGFPESHAASFAQLTYFSSWLKCHEPEAFLCGLLNSQPMGFYSPSQLIQDARRHGVEVRPANVMRSNWESTLEPLPGKPHARPAVRLGMSLLRGMPAEAALRIEQARAEQPFADVSDMARRAVLDRHALEALAAGDALRELAGHRRQALWHAVGAVPDRDILRPAARRDEMVELEAPTEGDQILGDYRAMNLTLRRHPLALLRETLQRRRFMCVADLNLLQDRQFASCCGIVTVRQRPATAKGVIFMTVEDETGSANVVIWPAVLERQRSEVLNARLLGVYGTWQAKGKVRHLVAGRLEDLTHLLGELEPRSRDFF
ncbi:error-prone DNA polymerase [Herbaspirillum sp. LeCh32-8]|uniref:error-prone DNA polymerase n=1 Tax=Herbaspirillum sp. LeCh32-8 TaxID=2821356 RepID=UPI001AE77CC8|nr:error-prone DNA polymerase [Herbaspirillum sp. LeCh32-8]MBP0597214.1 error-prone DNA polymerase [Herbaspirillum sp. LeCh32-8]